MKKMICCVLVACSLLLGACQSAPVQNEPAELFITENDGQFFLRDSDGNEIHGYKYPNGNYEYHLQSGKWTILDETGEVLYDDIDDMSSDNQAFTYLEDGRTLHRYFHPNGDLLLEGVGEEFSGWNYAGFGSCFYQLYWGATRVRNFDIDQEIFLPVSPSVGCLEMEMGKNTGILLLNDYTQKRSYLVDEDLNVTELDGYYVLYQDECGNPYLLREEGTLCTLDGKPLPSVFPEKEVAK